MVRNLNIFFVVVIVVLSTLLVRSCENANEAEAQLAAVQDTVKIWRDKYNHSNAEIQVIQADRDELKSTLDSVKKLDIKPRKVKSVVNATIAVRDTIRIDTVYQDRWSTFTRIDTFKLAYEIRDSISLITHKQHYGFLNLKTKYVTRAVTFNPNTTLTGLKSVEVKPKERRISFGIYAGYGLQLSRDGLIRHGWSTGVGFSYRIF